MFFSDEGVMGTAALLIRHVKLKLRVGLKLHFFRPGKM